ncbi:MAG TPA: hypothetical protein VJ853_03900 [Thermoanaerobaculia bacterium]|nr:hypothetical protein [Thermoanaerobaculia bacterium]
MRRILLLVVLVTAIVPTAPRLVDLLREARAMRPLSMRQRREKLMPDLYPAIEKLEDIPRPLALFGKDDVFLNFYLYPHPTRSYRTRWDYLAAKNKPGVIVRDGRLTTYAELRYDEIRKSRIVQNPQLPARTWMSFDIPIVTSTEGPAPVVYTIEGAISADSAAHVTLTLEPEGKTAALTVRGAQAFDDLVYQLFHTMTFIGWVRVTSDQPVRAAFWLVNRRARTAAPIRLTDGPLKRTAPFPVLESTANLWLVNFGGDYTMADVGRGKALVPPHGIIGMHTNGAVTGDVYAFISRKLPNGDTQFIWPEDLK